MKPSRRIGPALVALLGFSGALALVSDASAHLMTRPYDAPIVPNPRSVTPALPQGYLDKHEAGLTFAYHPSAHERVRAAIPVVLRVRKQISEQLGREVLATLEIRIAALPEEMHTLGPTEDVPSYAPAIAFSKHKLIVATLGSPRSLDQTDLGGALSHALAHVALDEVLDGKPAPLWLHEGYAARIAEDAATARAQMLVMATLQQRLFGIAEIGARFPVDAPETSLAYAQAADLTRFLSDKPRRVAFATMLEKVHGGEDFDRALGGAYGSSLASIERAWHRDMARRYGFLPVFLSCVAIWAFCAALIFLRRYFERGRDRQEKPSREVQLANLEAERMSAIEARAERIPVRSRVEGMGSVIPPEAEVPKVEHEGDWFTLH